MKRAQRRTLRQRSARSDTARAHATHLVVEIDAQLLKPIRLEDLESRDVQHANERLCASSSSSSSAHAARALPRRQALIDAVDERAKVLFVERLCERADLGDDLVARARLRDPLAAGADARAEERGRERVGGDAEEEGGLFERGARREVRRDGRGRGRRAGEGEGELAEVQDGGDDAEE